MLIGLMIVSVGTSAPEILICDVRHRKFGRTGSGQRPGSNIANVGLVLGVTLLFSAITLGRSTIVIDLPFLLAAVLLTWGLLWDLELSRTDSLILITARLFVRIAVHAKQPDINSEAEQFRR